MSKAGEKPRTVKRGELGQLFAEALGEIVLKPGDKVTVALTAESGSRIHTVMTTATFKA